MKYLKHLILILLAGLMVFSSLEGLDWMNNLEETELTEVKDGKEFNEESEDKKEKESNFPLGFLSASSQSFLQNLLLKVSFQVSKNRSYTCNSLPFYKLYQSYLHYH